MPSFTIGEETEDGRAVLTLIGDLDLNTVPEILEAITAQLGTLLEQARGLVVDLRQVDFIDSTGLGLVVGLRHRVHRSGGDVIARMKPGSQASVLFELTGLEATIPVERLR